jgi:hypothetical protein
MNDMEVPDVATLSGAAKGVIVDVSWSRYGDMVAPFATIFSIGMTLALR